MQNLLAPSHKPPSPLPAPSPIKQKFTFVVCDSAYLLGVLPSLWGTKSIVHPPPPWSRLFPPSIKQSIGGMRLCHFQKLLFSFLYLFCQLNDAVCRSSARGGQGVLWPRVGGRGDALAPGSPGVQGGGLP